MKLILVEVSAPSRVHVTPQEIADALAKLLPDGTSIKLRVRA
jgi:hypothetical protein